MRYLLVIVFVLATASFADAHGSGQFRSFSFNGHNQQFNRGNQFNDGFRQGFNAAQRQRFDNGGFHNQQFNRGFVRRPFFSFSF